MPDSAADSGSGFDDIPCLEEPADAGAGDVEAGGLGAGRAPVVTALGTVLSTEVVVAFIDSVKERFGVEPVCRVLSQLVCKIAPSTYYAAKARPPSARDLRDEKIKEIIEQVWHDPDGGRELAGARKMWNLLHRRQITVDGRPVARCTIERLMREMGLFGVRRGQSFYKTTCPDPALPSAVRPPDLVGRDFIALAPNRLWVVDFTYLDTDAGRAFAAFVLDVFSRRIVGWAVSDTHETELPLAALEMALHTRARAGHDPTGQVPQLVHHSDAGSEYTSITYQKALRNFDALASIGTVGDSYDNAMAESLNGLYKAECYWRQDSWADVAEIELATSSWVAWYNSSRPHSSIGDRTPIEYENAYYNGELLEPEDEPADQTLRGPDGRYLPRDNRTATRDTDRDINPRDLQHAG